MARARKTPDPLQSRLRRALRTGFGVALALLALFGSAKDLAAQSRTGVTVKPGVTAVGDAAVTGFSGAPPPARIAPGDDPAAKTFIDLNGPSLRIVDLRRMGGPPQAQLVGAPKNFTVKAALIGQVFGVAFDNADPPNVFAAATSAYGLPIVAPGAAGAPVHIRAGAPGAAFMPGLWGPKGGPGSIWRVDGASGAVRLFANIATNGRENSGAALGGMAYDSDSKMLFVADRETGLIHRLDSQGADLGTYDHGVAGRAALGLAAKPLLAPPPLDVTGPAFDSAEPPSWGYAPPERLIYGLAVHDRRLYYAVAEGLQVWSVELSAEGGFGADARLEIAPPPSNGPTEIAKITFDAEGRIYLAERAAPTGAFDFEALARPAIGRVLRYAAVGRTEDGRPIWQQAPDPYAIGFPETFRNANGGVAIGYGYFASGRIDRGACDGFLWSTGEQLRDSGDTKLAARLARGGETHVDGLQGNPVWRILRDREPPLVSYFIDYANAAPDPATRGHLGDVDIRRACEPGPAPRFGRPELPPPQPMPAEIPPSKHLPPPKPPAAPPGTPSVPPGQNNPPGCKPWEICGPGNTPCPANQVWRRDANACGPTCARPNVLVGGQCCPPPGIAATAASAVCSGAGCPSGQTAIGPSNFCCPSAQVYNNGAGQSACCASALINGQCPTSTPPTPPNCQIGANNPSCCPSGYVVAGNSCCLASQATSTGLCCPIGQSPTGANLGQCGPRIPIHVGPLCCAAGKIPVGDGSCCLPGNVTTSGQCCAAPVDPNNRTQCKSVTVPPRVCANGYRPMPDQSCCLSSQVGRDGKSCAGATPPPPRILRRPPVDCSSRGPRYIQSPRDAARCLRCPRGRIANDDGDACVASPRREPPPSREHSPRRPPRANCAGLGPAYIFDPEAPSTCMLCQPGTRANAAHRSCVRVQPGAGVIGPPGLFFGRPGFGRPGWGGRFPGGRFPGGGRGLPGANPGGIR